MKRALAYPLAVGSEVPILGRVKECADLVNPGQLLLDVGCSSGWLAPLVLRKGFRCYVGMDRVIVISAEKRKRIGDFVEGSVFDLPFGNGSFDAVCLFDVIEHLPRGSEPRALREAHRVLATNGRLYFSTPHASPIHAPLDPVWLLGHRHYRRGTVLRLLQTAGFIVDRVFVGGGVVEGLDHIRHLVYKYAFRRPQPTVEWVNRLTEQGHRGDQRLGLTVFAIASRP